MKTLVAIFTVLALLTLAQISEASDQSKDASTYKVSIPEENHKIAIVEAWLLPTDRSFYMFPGANQLPKRWATFVSDFQISDENGQPLAFLVNDDGSWQLEKMPNGRINVRYQVRFQPVSATHYYH